MTYLYLRYGKFSEGFEKYLELVNFETFSRNENCRIIFSGDVYNFFVLDELTFGISHRIYRIEKNKLFFIDVDTIEKKFYPAKPSTSGKLFYDNFSFAEDIFKNLEVQPEDYESFIQMIIRNKKFPLNYLNLNPIIEIFIKTGNLHKLLMIYRNFEKVSWVMGRFVLEGNYRPCNDPDALFDILLENPSIPIAVDNIDMKTSEENFQKFEAIRGKSKIYQEMVDFYKNKRTTILDESPNEIAREILKLRSGNFANYLLSYLIPNSEKIDMKLVQDILMGRFLPVKLRMDLFGMTLGKRLWKETNFQIFSGYINMMPPGSEAIANAIFDILMNKIELDITNITRESLYRILSNSIIPQEKRNDLEDFMKLSSKEIK